MASTLVKVAIGLAGVTTVGGGATFVYLNSGNNKAIAQDESKSNKGGQNEVLPSPEVKKEEPQANTVISTLFDKAKIKLLAEEQGDDDLWKSSWATFKAEYNALEEKEAWKFERWEGDGPEDDPSIKELKQKCTANSKEKVVNEQSQLFLEVKKFCTKSTAEQPENK